MYVCIRSQSELYSFFHSSYSFFLLLSFQHNFAKILILNIFLRSIFLFQYVFIFPTSFSYAFFYHIYQPLR